MKSPAFPVQIFFLEIIFLGVPSIFFGTLRVTKRSVIWQRYCIPPSKGQRYSAALFCLNGVLRPGGVALFVSHAYKRTQ